MRKTAIVFGATGVVGKKLLNGLSNTHNVIYAVVRKLNTDWNDSIHQVIVDKQHDLEHSSLPFHDSDVFVAIGTTRAKTPNKDDYFRIDHDIPVEIARICRLNNSRSLHVISAMGANPKSTIFYNATKGKMEVTVRENFEGAYFYRPSLIMGGREEPRLGERVAKGLFFVINPILPSNYKGVYPEQIANLMISNSMNLPERHLYVSRDFH